MAANDDCGDRSELGDQHPLAARANELDALSDGERDWITASVGGTDDTRRSNRSVSDDGGDVDRLVDDADRLAGEVSSLADARSSADAFACVDGVDAPTAAHLADAGVEDPDALVAADSSRLADELDVPITQVRTWQYQARTRR